MIPGELVDIAWSAFHAAEIREDTSYRDCLIAALEAYEAVVEEQWAEASYNAMLAAAAQPPAVVNDQLTTEPRSVAPPALYQHDDGRYALALSDVARQHLTYDDPGWHRVPIDIIGYGSGMREEGR